LNLLSCSAALLTFWWLARTAARAEKPPTAEDSGPFRVDPLKAAVPVIPLVILFAAPGFLALPGPFPQALTGPATVLPAMLIGVAAAGLTAQRLAPKLSGAFFEGAGYGYTQVISLIVTSIVYVEGVKATGLIRTVCDWLAGRPGLAIVLGGGMPW